MELIVLAVLIVVIFGLPGWFADGALNRVLFGSGPRVTEIRRTSFRTEIRG